MSHGVEGPRVNTTGVKLLLDKKGAPVLSGDTGRVLSHRTAGSHATKADGPGQPATGPGGVGEQCIRTVFLRLIYFITSVVQFMVYNGCKEIGSVLFYLPNKTNVKIVNIKCILIWLS